MVAVLIFHFSILSFTHWKQDEGAAVDLASILANFQRDNVDTTTPLTVVALRRHILKTACLALSKSYFAWHREPRIEFVSEMADDYGGPRREFMR